LIALIYAHPYPARSRANRVLLEAARGVPSVIVRSLYDNYPDFDIDVVAEQAAAARAATGGLDASGVLVQRAGLLKHWFDKVFAYGWAYGDGSAALSGKDCLWVASTGGTREGLRRDRNP
jgi:glutathione-regulated potassium-efflux system ancillary protein KefF